MTEQAKPFEPYVPAHKSIAEITVRAVVLGSILSVVMGLANTYLGLYAGMTVSASIPAAVISMAILRGIMRRGTILENNMVQTMASTGESMAAGAIFTIPALLLVGAWQKFEFWPTTLIVLLGSLLGIVFMVPMRRALVVGRKDLAYPEGVACAEVLIVGEEGGTGIKPILAGLGLGGVFKFMVTGLQWIAGTVEGAVAWGRSVFFLGADMSPALLAVGYIVNVEVAVLISIGGAIGWLVAMPIMGGYEAGPALDVAWEIWSSKVRYLGVGAMAVGGVYSIINVRKGIVDSIKALRGVKGQGKDGAEQRPRTERDMSLGWLLGIFLATTFATFLFYDLFIDNLPIAGLTTIIMVITSFVFVAVATYIVGLVGSSNSPVSGMTICALLITGGVLLAFGIRGDSAILATLGIAGVVCCATCTSGDIAQDLKTGSLVGATPYKQQWLEVLAAVVACAFFAPIMSLLHNAYGIGTGEPGSLRAPQAQLFATLVNGLFGDGNIPWNLVGIGAGLGIGLIILNYILQAAKVRFQAHVMPVAVGMYLPLSLDIPILIGGLLRYFMGRAQKAKPTSDARDPGVLFGAGLIAGEALIGTLLAIPIVLGVTLPLRIPTWIWSILLFAAVVYLYVIVSRRRNGNANGNNAG
ncbi:MAG: oligopeptide transporter, OPT family [Bradymonadales bacterium]|nr:oligopeptide transporter, OPT family [Bradymonadales bacterium]